MRSKRTQRKILKNLLVLTMAMIMFVAAVPIRSFATGETGFLMDVTTHAGKAVAYEIGVLDNGQYLHYTKGGTMVTVPGTFANLPDYLKGLYYVRYADTWGYSATAKTDCYVYALGLEKVATELKAAGFTYVACYDGATLGVGTDGNAIKKEWYLMEKQVKAGETVSFGKTQQAWGTLMTSATKLEVKATGYLASVSTHPNKATLVETGVLNNGEKLFTAKSGVPGTFQNLPDYLKGLYYVRYSDVYGYKITAKIDCWVYALVLENNTAELKAEGFNYVARYDGTTLGTNLDGNAIKKDWYLMEKYVEKGEVVSYGEESRGWSTLMTSNRQLDVQVTEYLATFGAHTGLATTKEIGIMNDDEYLLYTAGGTTQVTGEKFKNLPDYLKGLYYVRYASKQGYKITAKIDCYVYALGLEKMATELEAEGFKYVACYQGIDKLGGVPDGNAIKKDWYLMEKRVEKGEVVSFAEDGSGVWGTLMTSNRQLDVEATEYLGTLSTHADKTTTIETGVLNNGEKLYTAASRVPGTYQNLPDYLKGLYYVRYSDNYGYKITARMDCWVYALVLEVYTAELKAEGFNYVARYDGINLVANPDGNAIKKDWYLMEKYVEKGEVVSYGEDSRGWSTTMTSNKKLDVPNVDNWYDVSEYRSGETYTYPTKDGYVFAGWYTDKAYTTPLAVDVKTGTAYAKFVDKDVLSVKFQLATGATAQDATTTMRLVTSVDSGNYQYIGFKIAFTQEGTPVEKSYTTKKVYTSILGYDGETQITYYPNEFSEASQYIMAMAITGVPQAVYEIPLTITPVWLTLDGTIVDGTARTETLF